MERGRIGPRTRGGLLALALSGTLTLGGCHTLDHQPSIKEIEARIDTLIAQLESEPFPTSRYFYRSFVVDSTNKDILIERKIIPYIDLIVFHYLWMKSGGSIAGVRLQSVNSDLLRREMRVILANLFQILRLARSGYEIFVVDSGLSLREIREFARLGAQRFRTAAEERRYRELLDRYRKGRPLVRYWRDPKNLPPLWRPAILVTPPEAIGPLTFDEAMELMDYEQRLDRGETLTPEERRRHAILQEKAYRDEALREEKRLKRLQVLAAYRVYRELFAKPRRTREEERRLAELERFLQSDEVPERYRLPKVRPRTGRLQPAPYLREPSGEKEDGFEEVTM